MICYILQQNFPYIVFVIILIKFLPCKSILPNNLSSKFIFFLGFKHFFSVYAIDFQILRNEMNETYSSTLLVGESGYHFVNFVFCILVKRCFINPYTKSAAEMFSNHAMEVNLLSKLFLLHSNKMNSYFFRTVGFATLLWAFTIRSGWLSLIS